jgi:hypothetical protein
LHYVGILTRKELDLYQYYFVKFEKSAVRHGSAGLGSGGTGRRGWPGG